MTRKSLAAFLVLVFLVLVSGCGTICGAGKGAAEGAKEDWKAAQKADSWLRKNAW